jgi:hypothetical protein
MMTMMPLQPRFASSSFFLGSADAAYDHAEDDDDDDDVEERISAHLPLKHVLDLMALCVCGLIAMRLAWSWHVARVVAACVA